MSAPEWWLSAFRCFALIRRGVKALEGIHAEIKYQNERSFPPVTTPDRDVPRRPAIITGTNARKPEDV